jgi:hypothetical protein
MHFKTPQSKTSFGARGVNELIFFLPKKNRSKNNETPTFAIRFTN